MARQSRRDAIEPPEQVDDDLIELRTRFLALEHRRGREKASLLWNEAPPKKGRGRSPDIVRDIQLLVHYRMLMQKDPSLNPASAGRLLYETSRPGEYGNSAGAVTKKIRRLLESYPTWKDK